jgi:GNAT superfamily N-acetyltransferase
MGRKALVRIGRRDYAIPHTDLTGQTLVMVTENPGKGSLLAWRLRKGRHEEALSVRRAVRRRGRLDEGRELAAAKVSYYEELLAGGPKKVADVWDFLVSKRLRRKRIGSAMRELLLREMRDRGAERVVFPYHEEREFYEKMGFGRSGTLMFRDVPLVKYAGELSKLGLKPA